MGLIGNRMRKARSPKSARLLAFLPPAGGMCFSSGYSSRVAPLRCSFCFTGRSSYTSFPISGAKVQQLSDICKFFGKKMTKYVVKHKKEGQKPPFFRFIADYQPTI